MAIKCLHTDHSSVDQQGKAQKIQPEEVEGSTAHEGRFRPVSVCPKLIYIMDWIVKDENLMRQIVRCVSTFACLIRCDPRF